tara:strand:- start:567 stop:758 length:192 start_codon:yes stop_codon:yes gene_type:complete
MKVDLTLNQIDTIVYALEGYAQGNDDLKLVDDLNEIALFLDQISINQREKLLKAQAKQPTAEW